MRTAIVFFTFLVGIITAASAQEKTIAEQVSEFEPLFQKYNLEQTHASAVKLADQDGLAYLSALRGDLSGQVDRDVKTQVFFETFDRLPGAGELGAIDFAPAPSALDSDPRFLESIATVLETEVVTFAAGPTSGNAFDDIQADSEGRVRVFGFPVVGNDPYLDATLLIGASGICSGVLIDPTHVLTAAHCACRNVTDRVVFGQSILDLGNDDKVVDVIEVEQLIGCDEERRRGDLALVTLEEVAPAQPRAIATASMISRSLTTRMVGFGKTRDGVSGTKFYVDSFIASRTCEGEVPGPNGVGAQSDERFYGCMPGSELVAGGLDRDTCSGDSGGPGYIFDGQGNMLVAVATSRGVGGTADVCGQGGVYSLLATETVLTWLTENEVQFTLGED